MRLNYLLKLIFSCFLIFTLIQCGDLGNTEEEKEEKDSSSDENDDEEDAEAKEIAERAEELKGTIFAFIDDLDAEFSKQVDKQEDVAEKAEKILKKPEHQDIQKEAIMKNVQSTDGSIINGDAMDTIADKLMQKAVKVMQLNNEFPTSNSGNTDVEASRGVENSIPNIGSGPGSGCTDPTATNYDSTATSNDGSCQYADATNTGSGCTANQITLYELPTSVNSMEDFNDKNKMENSNFVECLDDFGSCLPSQGRIQFSNICYEITNCVEWYDQEADGLVCMFRSACTSYGGTIIPGSGGSKDSCEFQSFSGPSCDADEYEIIDPSNMQYSQTAMLMSGGGYDSQQIPCGDGCCTANECSEIGGKTSNVNGTNICELAAMPSQEPHGDGNPHSDDSYSYDSYSDDSYSYDSYSDDSFYDGSFYEEFLRGCLMLKKRNIMIQI